MKTVHFQQGEGDRNHRSKYCPSIQYRCQNFGPLSASPASAVAVLRRWHASRRQPPTEITPLLTDRGFCQRKIFQQISKNIYRPAAHHHCYCLPVREWQVDVCKTMTGGRQIQFLANFHPEMCISGYLAGAQEQHAELYQNRAAGGPSPVLVLISDSNKLLLLAGAVPCWLSCCSTLSWYQGKCFK